MTEILGTRTGSIRQNETDIQLLRRRGVRVEESITNISTELEDLPNLYVKSVPIREIVVLERAAWEAIVTPNPAILYCVYDEA